MSEGCSNTKRVFCCGRWITVQDIEEQDGKHRKDAAASLNMSESSLWRVTKELGIEERRQYPQRKKSSRLKSKVQSAKNKPQYPQRKKSSRLKSKVQSAKNKPQMEENDVLNDDGVDHMGAQPSLESANSLFNNLIRLPMQEISNPDNEASMKEALNILVDNTTVFSKEQADQINDLVFQFPILVGSCREYNSRYQAYNNPKLLDEVEKIRELVQTSEIEEESLKVRYEQLENKEKELRQQLGAVQREKAEIDEERIQKSKDPHQNTEQRLARIATEKLNSLSEQWAAIGSSFI